MYKVYLVTGISIFCYFIHSCNDKNEIIEYVSNDLYVYKNESGVSVLLSISNSQTDESDNFLIESGQSVPFQFRGNPGTAPFYGVGSSIVADRAILEFDDGKCLNFLRDNSDGITIDEGTGVFNINNYSVSIQSPLQKTNTYIITESDRLAAPNCP